MGSWLFVRRSQAFALSLTVLGVPAASGQTAVAQSAVASAAQATAPAPVTAAEREALVRLRTDRGGRAEEVDALLKVAAEALASGLPVAPLTNKIREGLAKGADPRRIDTVVRQMASHLDAADRLIREIDPSATPASRAVPVTLLGEAFGSGVTAEETRGLRRSAQAAGQPPVTAEMLASAARSLSFIKEAGLPSADGSAVVVAGVRQGYRSFEVVDIGREVKRREVDYRSGRSTLRALRDAIARGERPEQLFRPVRPETPERPAATRPETVDRPARPETPQRPEMPTRPERPEAGRAR